jgi:trans-aconitate methyltransferase
MSAYFEAIAPFYSLLSRFSPWALLRKREANFIFRELPLERCASLLDVGCGAGYYMAVARSRYPHLRLVGCDSSPTMAASCRKLGFSVYSVPVESLETAERFDAILCVGALEFMEQPSAFFRKAAELLAPNGILAVFVPSTNLWGTAYNFYHSLLGNNVRINSAESYIQIAALSGIMQKPKLSRFVTGSVLLWEKRGSLD